MAQMYNFNTGKYEDVDEKGNFINVAKPAPAPAPAPSAAVPAPAPVPAPSATPSAPVDEFSDYKGGGGANDVTSYLKSKGIINDKGVVIDITRYKAFNGRTVGSSTIPQYSANTDWRGSQPQPVQPVQPAQTSQPATAGATNNSPDTGPASSSYYDEKFNDVLDPQKLYNDRLAEARSALPASAATTASSVAKTAMDYANQSPEDFYKSLQFRGVANPYSKLEAQRATDNAYSGLASKTSDAARQAEIRGARTGYGSGMTEGALRDLDFQEGQGRSQLSYQIGSDYAKNRGEFDATQAQRQMEFDKNRAAGQQDIQRFGWDKILGGAQLGTQAQIADNSQDIERFKAPYQVADSMTGTVGQLSLGRATGQSNARIGGTGAAIAERKLPSELLINSAIADKYKADTSLTDMQKQVLEEKLTAQKQWGWAKDLLAAGESLANIYSKVKGDGGGGGGGSSAVSLIAGAAGVPIG